jgi:hypothetical protein
MHGTNQRNLFIAAFFNQAGNHPLTAHLAQ